MLPLSTVQFFPLSRCERKRFRIRSYTLPDLLYESKTILNAEAQNFVDPYAHVTILYLPA